MLTTKNKQALAVSLAVMVLLGLTACWLLFSPFAKTEEDTYIYIDSDDTADSVYAKVGDAASFAKAATFRVLAAATGYAAHVHPGCYQAAPSVSTLRLVHRMRTGQQTPVRFTVPIVRTVEDLSERLGTMLEPAAADFYAAFTDSALCARYGLTPATIQTLFIPNTYEVYWTVSPQELLDRMKRESDDFWTPERLAKAKEAQLTPVQVITLASIVEQETAYGPEKPAVAGMYINRLRKGMKLQADPTVKFALGDFGLRRILNVHLTADSPYNTYKYQGLPPGPICIPSVASIEAVLNFEHHDYIFMCAKEDFSGSHRFAATGEEHMKNAKRYAEALDKRGVK